MKGLIPKVVQVPIDILVGLAVYSGMKYAFHVSEFVAIFAALLACSLFAELVGLRLK